MTRPISVTVNGEKATALVEPRLHLADFLRGHLGLTGTHLGCEQGVCGACTVIIDGRTARSCITFAVACDGAEVTTIEGLDNDPLAKDLREAFSEHHGLQCGFCTPGMLIAARDLVMRHGECLESKIREELSGNLCRCTGYMGIVAAVRQTSLGRNPVTRAEPIAAQPIVAQSMPVAAQATSVAAASAPTPSATTTGEGWSEIVQRLDVPLGRETVWQSLKDIGRIVECVPGAQIDARDGNAFQGRLTVKLGPIRASFKGEGTVTYDDAAKTGILGGKGRDTASGSNATGEAAFAVVERSPGAATIELKIRYRMTGMLAQFSRGALVKDLVAQIGAIFAQNLAASALSPGQPPPRRELSGIGLAWSLLLARLRAFWTR